MTTHNVTASQRFRLIALAALAGALAACGGGGGGYGGGSGNPAATAAISVTPSTITAGQSATLTWSSNTACTASGGWTGAQAATGTLDVTPTTTGAVDYTLTCTGSGYTGTATESATLTVNAASAYTATSLVEDIAGGTQRTTDPLLVNPWGLALGPPRRCGWPTTTATPPRCTTATARRPRSPRTSRRAPAEPRSIPPASCSTAPRTS